MKDHTDASAPRPGRRGGLRRLRRVVAVAMGVLLIATVVPDSGRPEPTALLVRVASDDGRAQAVGRDPATTWILALGSDAREGESIGRSRADAIQLIGFNARTGHAAVLGIPRDSYVAIPGAGRSRINAAAVFGGPQLMARTVRDLTGIRPDYVVVAGFGQFERMVDAIGGITVRSPFRFSDGALGSRQFQVGENRLNGRAAHHFSRIRKSLARGDFERSANQQRTLLGILREVRRKADRPGFIERGTLSAVRNLTTDLGPIEAYRLAQAVTQVRPARTRVCVLRGSIGSAGAASVVFPDVAQARSFGRRAERGARLRGGC